MKTILYFIILSFFVTSCGKKKTDEKVIKVIKIADVTKVVGIGKIQPENDVIQLSAEVGGIVEKINVHENDTVKKGEIILVLKHSIEEADVAEIKSQISTQSAQINANETNIKLAKIKYENANIELQRLKKLLADGAETQQVVDNAETELKTYSVDIDQQKALVEVSKRKLVEIKKQIKISNATLNQRFVKSPIDGILLEMSVLIGGVVNSQTPFAQLASDGKTIAVCEIDEMFAPKIKINQRAIIRDAGSSDTLSSGIVYFVSTFLKTKSLFTDQAGEKEDRRVREIKIRLDNPKKMLLNTRVECIIMLDKNAK